MPHTNVVIRGNYSRQTNTHLRLQRHLRHRRPARASSSATSARTPAPARSRSTTPTTSRSSTTRRSAPCRRRAAPTPTASTPTARRPGTIIQYNYVHDNGDGILLCQFAFGDSIVRYNVLVNNSRHGINLHSDASATNQTYNNLFFIEGLGEREPDRDVGDGQRDAGAPPTRSGTTSCARRARRRWSSPAAASRTQQPVLGRDRRRQRAADRAIRCS